MSKIRVTYSGLISFATNLVTVVTGLIFVIIVTRTLTIEEFGTWGLISGLFAYAVVIGQQGKLHGGRNLEKQQLQQTACYPFWE